MTEKNDNYDSNSVTVSKNPLCLNGNKDRLVALDPEAIHHQLSWRGRIWIFFDDPSSSDFVSRHNVPEYGAFTINCAAGQAQIWGVVMMVFVVVVMVVVVMVVVVMSTVAYMIKSLERFYSDSAYPFFNQLDIVCFIIFSIDYSGRILSAPSSAVLPQKETIKMYINSRVQFALKVGNLVDFLSIFPFFIDLILSAVGSTTSGNAGAIARVVRIFRLLKLIRMKRFQSELQVQRSKGSRAQT